jgi:hypothetical protein
MENAHLVKTFVRKNRARAFEILVLEQFTKHGFPLAPGTSDVVFAMLYDDILWTILVAMRVKSPFS